jgi:hypothetical protein
MSMALCNTTHGRPRRRLVLLSLPVSDAVGINLKLVKVDHALQTIADDLPMRDIPVPK